MADETNDEGAIHTSLSGPGVYPVKYAHLLVNPLRWLICPPGWIVKHLHLKPDHQALELGPGPGYFSVAAARRLPQGKLTLADIQAGMLKLAEARLRKRGLSNFTCVETNAASLPFPDASFDVAFMVTVLGEVGDDEARGKALREIVRVLKPGGLLSVTEMIGDPDYVRIPALERLAASAGLQRERRYGPRWFYTYNFRKA